MEELREPTKEEMKHDRKFLARVIWEIVVYAEETEQNPDDVLKAVADWILALLKIATFNRRAKDDSEGI